MYLESPTSISAPLSFQENPLTVREDVAVQVSCKTELSPTCRLESNITVGERGGHRTKKGSCDLTHNQNTYQHCIHTTYVDHSRVFAQVIAEPSPHLLRPAQVQGAPSTAQRQRVESYLLLLLNSSFGRVCPYNRYTNQLDPVIGTVRATLPVTS